VVVGGSLVGLSAAIALSRLGTEVTVAERSPARAADGGGGLGVDVALLREVTAIKADPPVLHGIDRDGSAWHLLQGWLEEHAAHLPGVRVLRSKQVCAVTPGDGVHGAAVRTAQGDAFAADLVVGADGARSTVRATVDPAHPEARYAGVLLWRTLVDERAMPPGVKLPGAGEPAREVYAGPYRLVTYPVPGPGGETAVGHRRLNLVWYDPQQRELLHEAGLLDGQTVHGTLAPGALPGPVRQRLAAAGRLRGREVAQSVARGAGPGAGGRDGVRHPDRALQAVPPGHWPGRAGRGRRARGQPNGRRRVPAGPV
jgi:2-polyprenyl-6-methoxyphenol hydroxylase-like FAD-dependent oxidoreductase